MKMYAVVSLRKEGMHFYENAPDEVEFLRHPHRHMFHIKVFVQQFHDDRDVEYIMLKRFLDKKCILGDFLVGSSCEQIAKRIIELVKIKYGKHRKVKVEVFEDGENGTVVSV